MHYRAGFAYNGGVPSDEVLRLCRLRYAGYANQWGFAVYQASHDDFEETRSILALIPGPSIFLSYAGSAPSRKS